MPMYSVCTAFLPFVRFDVGVFAKVCRGLFNFLFLTPQIDRMTDDQRTDERCHPAWVMR